MGRPIQPRIKVPRVSSWWLLSVDPGCQSPGAALWAVEGSSSAELVASTEMRPYWPSPRGAADEVAKWAQGVITAHPEVAGPLVLVVEWPEVRPHQPAARKAVAALREMVRALPWTPGARYRPDEWKGTLPKNITKNRLQDLLQLTFAGTDAADAVGIGAYALGLVDRGVTRVRPAGSRPPRGSTNHHRSKP